MSLSSEKAEEINQRRILAFLNPLLLGIQDDESLVYNKFSSNIQNKTTFNFNRNFILFTDIQAYRHVSILGITNTFDRSLKYKVLNLALLLDVWYNESTLCNKDELRTCDLLIIHGVNDVRFGIQKAEALINLISVRKALGKLTWIFINGCSPETYSQNQPGVFNEIKNIYDLRLAEHEELTSALNNLKEYTLIYTNLNEATSDNTETRMV